VTRDRLVAALAPLAALTLAVTPSLGQADARKLSRGELVRLGQSASALVVMQNGSGSSFCVRPDGLFVTNHHVIRYPRHNVVLNPDRTATIGPPPIKLVLNSGEAGQKVVSAKILWSDPSWDLALLRAEGVVGFPALEVAGAEELKELDEVVAFGFPLGTALAGRGDQYPAPNVTKGRVRSIPTEAGDPVRIESDVTINPGNSGGPLLDGRGRVVGVVFAITANKGDTSWTSLSVPATRLESFMSRPEIAFEPPFVLRTDKAKPTVFKAVLSSLFPSRDPLTVELVFGATGAGERRVPMALADGAYRAETTPFLAEGQPPLIKLTVEREALTDVAWVADRELRVVEAGAKTKEPKRLHLSDASKLTLGKFWDTRFELRRPESIHLTEINSYTGKVIGLDGLLEEIGAQVVNLDPKDLTAIEVGGTTGQNEAPTAVEVRRLGRLVARSVQSVFASDAVPATLRDVSEGRFREPRRSESPVNYFRYHIPAGDPAMRAPNYAKDKRKWTTLDPNGADAPITPGETFREVPEVSSWPWLRITSANRKVPAPPRAVRFGFSINGIGPGGTSLFFSAPGAVPIEPGEYIVEIRPHDYNGPEAYVRLDTAVREEPKIVGLTPPQSGADRLEYLDKLRKTPKLAERYSGRFRVWEYADETKRESNGQPIRRAAIDFVLYRHADGKTTPSVSGMLRVNSSFE
jgi:hypothetical protein